MNKKIYIHALMILLLVTSVFACKEVYDIYENVVITDQIEELGTGADCNTTIAADVTTMTFIDTGWWRCNATVNKTSIEGLEADQEIKVGTNCAII